VPGRSSTAGPSRVDGTVSQATTLASDTGNAALWWALLGALVTVAGVLSLAYARRRHRHLSAG
jgi:hypothetical protein